jgi:hypothetical protein
MRVGRARGDVQEIAEQQAELKARRRRLAGLADEQPADETRKR